MADVDDGRCRQWRRLQRWPKLMHPLDHPPNNATTPSPRRDGGRIDIHCRPHSGDDVPPPPPRHCRSGNDAPPLRGIKRCVKKGRWIKYIDATNVISHLLHVTNGTNAISHATNKCDMACNKYAIKTVRMRNKLIRYYCLCLKTVY